MRHFEQRACCDQCIQFMNDSDKYFMMTTRLGFRRWRENDLPLALGLWGDYEVTKLIDARGQFTTNQVQERLIKEIATEREHGVQYWPIFLRKKDEHIGCCGLRPYDLAKRHLKITSYVIVERSFLLLSKVLASKKILPV